MWLNHNIFINENIDKTDDRVAALKEWVDEQYASGRVTQISNNELWEASKGSAYCEDVQPVLPL